jgi:hypothetical protein
MSISPAAPVRHRIPRIAEAAVERARLTVVPRARTRAARIPFVALVSMLLLGGVVGLLLFNTSMQQASFATTALEDQATTLSAREETLKMELEHLRDPQRLAGAAQSMNMVPPPPPCFLRLNGKVEGTCSAAVATDDLPIGSPPPAKPAALSPDPITVRGPATTGTSGDTTPDTTPDTTRGDGTAGRPEGRTGQQQSQQTQQSQQNQTQTRTR